MSPGDGDERHDPHRGHRLGSPGLASPVAPGPALPVTPIEEDVITKRIAAVAGSCALLVGLTACTPETPDAAAFETLPAVSIDEYQEVTATLDYESGTARLPLDDLSLQEPAAQAKMLQAIAARTDRCLEERGFQTLSEQIDWTPFAKSENRRYGSWSVELAGQYGYDSPPDRGIQTLTVSTVGLGVEFNDAFTRCNESARQELQSQIEFFQAPNIDYRIRSQAEQLATSHPDGAGALDAWQACMEEQGIVLDAETGLPSQQYTQQGKESEIRAALAQSGCAVSTGAIQTLFDLQARYEQAFLDDQAAQVREFESARNAVIAELDDAIGDR